MPYLRNLGADTRSALTPHGELLVFAGVAAVVLVFGRYQLGPTTGYVTRLVRTCAMVETSDPDAGLRQFVHMSLRTILYLLVPLLSALAFRVRLRDIGFRWTPPADWLRDIIILYLVMLPILFLAVRRPAFRRAYPIFILARQSWAFFVVGLAVRLAHMFAWEFLFRGYLLLGFARRTGPLPAIAVSTIPFVLMHFGKPLPEIYGSIFAGIALAVVALRARSFIPCAILHFAVASTLDLAARLT